MALSNVCELFKANEPSWDTSVTPAVQRGMTPVALTAATAVYVPAVGRNVIIGITPTANGTVKVYKGDGVAAMNDFTFAVTKDKISFIELDTSSFEIIDPDDANVGSIKLECSAAGTLVAVNAL